MDFAYRQAEAFVDQEDQLDDELVMKPAHLITNPALIWLFPAHIKIKWEMTLDEAKQTMATERSEEYENLRKYAESVQVDPAQQGIFDEQIAQEYKRRTTLIQQNYSQMLLYFAKLVLQQYVPHLTQRGYLSIMDRESAVKWLEYERVRKSLVPPVTTAQLNSTMMAVDPASLPFMNPTSKINIVEAAKLSQRARSIAAARTTVVGGSAPIMSTVAGSYAGPSVVHSADVAPEDPSSTCYKIGFVSTCS